MFRETSNTLKFDNVPFIQFSTLDLARSCDGTLLLNKYLKRKLEGTFNGTIMWLLLNFFDTQE